MPQNMTARHALPNLFVGQAQKELTHNEALARIDALLHPVVEERLIAPPAGLLDTDDGKCWLVDSPATGLWLGKESQIARWSGGSWRFLMPVEGMSLWYRAGTARLFYIEGDWVDGPAIANPTGGATVDAEARSALVAILDHLRQISNIAV
jgi:hypothetical protein